MCNIVPAQHRRRETIPWKNLTKNNAVTHVVFVIGVAGFSCTTRNAGGAGNTAVVSVIHRRLALLEKVERDTCESNEQIDGTNKDVPTSSPAEDAVVTKQKGIKS